jgi:hypothetical protein
MVESGFTNIIDMRGGFYGEVDQDGLVSCQGWQQRGLPVATGDEPGRSHAYLRKPT